MSVPQHPVNGTPDHTAPKTVVIIGTARGGTSMVAGTVREMGINLGERLAENHEDPEFLPKDLNHIRNMITKRNAALETWGWKMPHTLEYIEKIEADIRNPHIICVWRNTLATARSQATRSTATLHDGLHYSSRRLLAMADKTAILKSPTLMVNYDHAILNKDEFINALSAFLGITVDRDMLKRCHQFIDPETGYQQISETFYKVEPVDYNLHPKQLAAVRTIPGIKRVPGQDYLAATSPHPQFIYKKRNGRTFPREFVVRFRNRAEKNSKVQFLFDFDGHFTLNMAYKTEVEPGIHGFKIITNGQLQRFAVMPSVTNNICDLFFVDLRIA